MLITCYFKMWLVATAAMEEFSNAKKMFLFVETMMHFLSIQKKSDDEELDICLKNNTFIEKKVQKNLKTPSKLESVLISNKTSSNAKISITFPNQAHSH